MIYYSIENKVIFLLNYKMITRSQARKIRAAKSAAEHAKTQFEKDLLESLAKQLSMPMKTIVIRGKKASKRRQ